MNPEVRIFILSGGLGTRLAHITKDVPKPMAQIAGRPFLEWQIEGFRKQGFLDFVLLVGHKKEAIMDHFGDGTPFGVRIEYSVEQELLGTGGAFLQALRTFPCGYFVLVNGDTYFDVNLGILLKLARQNATHLWMALKYMSDLSRYGRVEVDSRGQVLAFSEKDPSARNGLINGGVYAGHSSLWDGEPVRRASMEVDCFPDLLHRGSLFATPCGEPFIDIGVPEDYSRAQSLLPQWDQRKKTPALFLDRDGVLIEDSGYVGRVSDVRILEAGVGALKLAQASGYKLIVVSNQAGVAKGKFSALDVEAVNLHVKAEFGRRGINLEAFYYCPHHPDGSLEEFRCDCFDRKPNPGLFLKAIEEHAVDLERSLMIGDKDSDVIVGLPLSCWLVQGAYPLNSRERVLTWDEILDLVSAESRFSDNKPTQI